MPEIEKHQQEDREYNAKDSRRSFLKAILGTAGAATIAAVGYKEAAESGQREKEAIINEMSATTGKVNVESGDTLWDYYEKSGWKEVPSEYYIEAVKKLNPNEDVDHLKPGMELVIPIKGEE